MMFHIIFIIDHDVKLSENANLSIKQKHPLPFQKNLY